MYYNDNSYSIGHTALVKLNRVIDGALGAEYLKALRQLLENPTLLLI